MPAAAKKVEENKTYKINEVEIFSAGKWNGDQYTIEDLNSIVLAFNSLKDGFKPFLKLGHDDKQKWAFDSGLPAIGWVDRVYVKGDKLLADFDYIPEKIFELIESRAYRKVSCEIYWDLDVNGIKYPKVLAGVALLGAETPGVMNLDDILGLYTFKPNTISLVKNVNNEKFYKYKSIELKETKMDQQTEKELALETELAEQKKQYALAEEQRKVLVQEKEAQDKEIEELKKFKLEAEAEKQKALEAAEVAKREKFVAELEGKKLISPSMKEFTLELLGDDKKEYTIKEKKYSKEEMIEQLLTLSKENSKVNFDDSSLKDFAKKDKEEDMEKAIQKYMKDNGGSYENAYKAVMKDKKSDMEKK